MADAVPLLAGQGSYLCTVSFYRRADGEITATLDVMPTHVIDGEETITARFFKAASWCFTGALDLMRQGLRFDEETRAALEHGEPGK